MRHASVASLWTCGYGVNVKGHVKSRLTCDLGDTAEGCTPPTPGPGYVVPDD